MALRFQDNDDEVDPAAKEKRATPVLILLLVLVAAIHGLSTWVTGESFASYAKDMVWFVGFGFAYWFLAPFYYEFRIRAKEIDGKVSAIEKTVAAMREDHKELVEKLDGLEEELRSLRN